MKFWIWKTLVTIKSFGQLNKIKSTEYIILEENGKVTSNDTEVEKI